MPRPPILSAVMPLLLGAGVLGGCMTAPAPDSQQIWLGQVSQGARFAPVAVTSWKEMKFSGLVRQETDFSCGAAVMATIFNEAYGRRTTEQQVLVNMLRIADPDVVREKGFSLLDMKNYARSLGMQAEGYRISYEQLAQIEMPTIALLDIKGYKHFVVIRKVFGDRVAVGDPALGNRYMSRREFEQAWNSVAFLVAGDGYDPGNALANPPPPLSAKRLLDMHALLPAAEPAEFGNSASFRFSF